MKREDIKIGMKVKTPKSPNNYGNSVVVNLANKRGQKWCFVTGFTSNYDGEYIIVNEDFEEGKGDYFLPDELEPYEEGNMDEKLVKIEKLEKELAELKALVEADKKPKKDWPDSFEEAMKISKYWGMEVDGTRFMIVTTGPAMRAAVRPSGTWSDFNVMDNFWRGAGRYKCKFVAFDSDFSLFKWMMEGETK